MSVMIQLRNVPDALHRRLKARAARLGLSLSDYCRRELERAAITPSLEEALARIATREPVELPVSAAELVRAERDAR